MGRSKFSQFQRSVRQSLIEDFKWPSNRATAGVKKHFRLVKEKYNCCYPVYKTAKILDDMRYSRVKS